MTPEKIKKITYPKGGSAEIHEIEGMRKIIIDTVSEGRKVHHVNALMQLDVTKPRQFLKSYAEQHGKSLSFTGYLLYCLAKAVDENKSVAGYRVGNKVYVFDEVDISTIVERKSADGSLLQRRLFCVGQTIKPIKKSVMKSVHSKF